MSDAYVLEATSRADAGKGASRRLRRLENKVPGIVYGGKSDPVSISMDHDPLFHQLENEAFFSSIIQLKIDGKGEDVLLKDLQRHPAKNIIMHADFLRVDKNQAIVVQVPCTLLMKIRPLALKCKVGVLLTRPMKLKFAVYLGTYLNTSKLTWLKSKSVKLFTYPM